MLLYALLLIASISTATRFCFAEDVSVPAKYESDETSLPSEYYSTVYQAVNNYLMDKIEDEDPEKNMELLKQRLLSGQADSRELKVLQKLTAMESAQSNCDRLSYETLKDNHMVTKKQVNNPDQENARRIDLLINHYCRKHAQRCRSSIENAFMVRHRTVDRKVVRSVATWTNALIEERFSQTDLDKYMGDESALLFAEIILKEGGHIEGQRNTEIVYRTLRSLVENSSESKYLGDHVDEQTGRYDFFGNKITLLFTKWLIVPCGQFVKLFGPELFDNADFDANFSHEVHPSQPEFYQAWSRYKLCQRLIKSNQSLGKDLVEYAKKMNDLGEE